MIKIQAIGFSLTDALRDRVQQRANFILGNIGDHVINVDVKLSDINGPKGGIDKRCQVLVRLAGLSDVVVTDTQNDMYYAIDRAFSRILRAVRRKVSQKMTRRDSKHHLLLSHALEAPSVGK